MKNYCTRSDAPPSLTVRILLIVSAPILLRLGYHCIVNWVYRDGKICQYEAVAFCLLKTTEVNVLVLCSAIGVSVSGGLLYLMSSRPTAIKLMAFYLGLCLIYDVIRMVSR